MATDPTTDPTLSAQPAKKAAALPLATTTNPAASTATEGTATTQPAGTAQPGGTALPLAPPAGPATTSDPMAFAANGGGTPPIPADPAAGAAPAALPLSGFNEAQKNEYWAKQGVQVAPSAMGLTPTGVGANSVNTYNPDQVAAGQAKIAGGTDSAVTGALGKLYQPETQPVFDPAAATQAGLDAAHAATAEASAKSGWNAPNTMVGGPGGYNNLPGALPLAPNAGGTPPIPGDPTATMSHLTPGPASDINGMAPATNPTATVGMGSTPAPLNGLPNTPPTSTVANGTVGLTPTTPETALTNSTLSVGPTADRFKIANDQLHSQITNELEPQFQADARTIAAQSFGAGRGVSGMNRTREGDLALQHSRDINQLEANNNANALEGTIGDAYRNVGIAQQQQGFESGQQQQGFNQGTELERLADSERAQSFAEAMAQANLGFSGSPADFLKWIAGQYARSGAGS